MKPTILPLFFLPLALALALPLSLPRLDGTPPSIPLTFSSCPSVHPKPTLTFHPPDTTTRSDTAPAMTDVTGADVPFDTTAAVVNAND